MQITHELHNNNLTIKFNNFKCNINLDGFSLANRHSWGCSFENNETVKKTGNTNQCCCAGAVCLAGLGGRMAPSD